MSYRRNCNYSSECPSIKFCNADIQKKIEMCDNCPGCGCCMFCGDREIPRCNFPLFQYTSTNYVYDNIPNSKTFDLEQEIKQIDNMYDRNMALNGLYMRTGMIGNIPRISTKRYFD